MYLHDTHFDLPLTHHVPRTRTLFAASTLLDGDDQMINRSVRHASPSPPRGLSSASSSSPYSTSLPLLVTTTTTSTNQGASPNRDNDLGIIAKVKEGGDGDERDQLVALLPEVVVRDRNSTGTTIATTGATAITGATDPSLHLPSDDRGGATRAISLRSSTASRRRSSFLHSPATATFAAGISPTSAGLAAQAASHNSRGGAAAAAGATHSMGMSSAAGELPSSPALLYTF